MQSNNMDGAQLNDLNPHNFQNNNGQAHFQNTDIQYQSQNERNQVFLPSIVFRSTCPFQSSSIRIQKPQEPIQHSDQQNTQPIQYHQFKVEIPSEKFSSGSQSSQMYPIQPESQEFSQHGSKQFNSGSQGSVQFQLKQNTILEIGQY